MSKEKERKLTEISETLKHLSEKSLLLVENSANTLKTRELLEEDKQTA